MLLKMLDWVVKEIVCAEGALSNAEEAVALLRREMVKAEDPAEYDCLHLVWTLEEANKIRKMERLQELLSKRQEIWGYLYGGIPSDEKRTGTLPETN